MFPPVGESVARGHSYKIRSWTFKTEACSESQEVFTLDCGIQGYGELTQEMRLA